MRSLSETAAQSHMDGGVSPFCVRYVSGERAAELRADERLIASVAYGGTPADDPDDPCHFVVALPQLAGGAGVEVWLSPEPVERGLEPPVAFSRNDAILFGRVRIDEAAFSGLEVASRDAYRAIYSVCRRMGYPYPLRIWNYFPRIRDEEGGMERYRSFCVGRHRALAEASVPEHLLAAASCIGTRTGGLEIHFLAARHPGIQVENPRQISAFHYPPRYSPKSPAFSRAVIKSWGGENHLYVSGTASIVGHESRHENRVAAQLEETMENIENLIQFANDRSPLRIASIGDLSALKVYVRHARDQETIARQLRARVGPALPVLYLRGDLCRRELLLELEGLYSGPGSR